MASSELLDGGGSKQSELPVGALRSGVFLGGQSSVNKNVPLVAVNQLESRCLPLQKKGVQRTRAIPPARKLLPQGRHLCRTDDHFKSRVEGKD